MRNFEQKNKNYESFGGEFSDDNFHPFNIEYVLEKKENLPKILFRGVKKNARTNTLESATESLKKINDSEDSLVNWQTESMSTTESRNVAFDYALEGELRNKIDLVNKKGEKIFKFLKDNQGTWLLSHYPEHFVEISDEGKISINWESVKKEALKILDEQTELSKIHLEQNKKTFEEIKEKEDERYLDIYRKNIKEGEEKTSSTYLEDCKRLIDDMNDENVTFTIDGEVEDATLGYLFELEPKDHVRVATRESVDKFMEHHRMEHIVKPGKATEGSQKERLTNKLKDAGFGGIDKNSFEKEIGIFNPQDLKPLFVLEIGIKNGKLVAEKHILNNGN